MRATGIIAIVLSSGCCSFGDAPPEPPSRAVPVGAAPIVDPACIGLCERIAECDRDEGRTPSAGDCSAGCAPGGVFASLDAAGLACAERASCAAVRECAGPVLAVALLGSIASAAPTTAPPDWPAGFPTVPGGVPRAAPTMGPVRVALLAYPSRDVDTTVRSYRDALGASGWTLADAPSGDGEAHRFTASRAGSGVSVSIYRDGSDTIVQTMQLGSTEGGR